MRDDSLEKSKEMRKIMIAREKILETIFTWTSDDWIHIPMFKKNKLLFMSYRVDGMCRHMGMVGIFERETLHIPHS